MIEFKVVQIITDNSELSQIQKIYLYQLLKDIKIVVSSPVEIRITNPELFNLLKLGSVLTLSVNK